MKELTTIHGETILVDDEDFEKAEQHSWKIKHNRSNKIQVVTYFKIKKLTYTKLILDINTNFILFKNENPLDLRKENIMVFETKGEFVRNMIKQYRKKQGELKIKETQSRSGEKFPQTLYFGTSFDLRNRPRPWGSFIRHNYKNYGLGNFTKEEHAALAYDKKAIELCGPDTIRNFPHLTLEEVTENLEKIKAEDEITFHDQDSKCHQGILLNVVKTSKYLGVSIKKNCRWKKWKGSINYHGKHYHLGYFYSEEEAARAYDEKAIELFGENARLNFPCEQ